MAVSFPEYESKKAKESRKIVIVKYTSSKAMVAIDGVGFDWNYLGDDEVPTNIVLMAFSDSEYIYSKIVSSKALPKLKMSSEFSPNGDALRKCILNGPYIPTTVVVQAVAATDDSLAIPEHIIVETPMNMSPANKAHFESEKEAIHLILTGIGDKIYSTVDACQTAQEMWEAIERLQQGKLTAISNLFILDHPYGFALDPHAPIEIHYVDWKEKHIQLHHSYQFRAPTAKDMKILIKTCLMPLAFKTQNDSFRFVHELKQEIHADLKYVESLENEIDELESDKAEFSNMCDIIFELKKLIKKCKGKSMETKFDKPFVVRQPNDQQIPKSSVLGKPTPFLDSLERIYFSKTKSIPKTNVSEGLSKTVTAQTLPQTARQAVSNINVLKPGMYQIDNRTTQTRAPQSPQTFRNTNPSVSNSIRVNHKTNVSRPQIRSNYMKDKVVPNNSQVKLKKTQVDDHPRIPSISNKTKSVTVCNDSLNSKTSHANVICATCGKCLVDSDHFACVTKMLNDVNARTKKPNVVPISTRKPKGLANKSVTTPHKKKVASKSTTQKPKRYYRMLYEKSSKAWKWWIEQQCPSGYKWVPKTKMKWVPKARNENVQKRIVHLILFIVDSGCTKHMTGTLKLLCNFVEKFLGLNHNLFSVGQFCDADLEVAFRKSTCFVRDLQGNDLLTGNRGSDLYTISFQELTSSTPLYLMAKASPTQAWLWHRRLSHLNFDYINLLSKKDVVIGLPKLKYVKDQLCSSCEVSKAKRSSFKSKVVPSFKGRLNLLHMDLCGPMRVASINRKKYILVIVDDYSRYTWTLFLRSNDETPEASDYENSDPVPQLQNASSLADAHVPSQQELDLLFGPFYDEFFTAGTSSVNKSSSPTNNSTQKDTQPTTNIKPTSEPSTPIYVPAKENNDNQTEEEHLQDDEFTNPF
nr:hypothetical protein [Tanacetum cinerariifolium]